MPGGQLPGDPMPGGPVPGGYGPPPGWVPPSAPPPGTSGLSIAGLVLAFLLAPIGFIVSLIALIVTGRSGQRGRGLAVAGLIVSVLMTAGGITAITLIAGKNVTTIAKNVNTITDPGCVKGKEAILSMPTAPSDPAAMKAELQSVITGLNAAAASAQHESVRNAMKALSDDYGQLASALSGATQPPANLESKIRQDANQIDNLCTLGGAK